MCKGKTIARNLFFSLIISFLANVICFTLFAHTSIVSTVFAAEPTEYADCYTNLSKYFAPTAYFDVKSGMARDTTYTSMESINNTFKSFMAGTKNTVINDKSLFVPLFKESFKNTQTDYIIDDINDVSKEKYIVCYNEKLNISNTQNSCINVTDEEYLKNNKTIDNLGLQTYNKCTEKKEAVWANEDHTIQDTDENGNPLFTSTQRDLYIKQNDNNKYKIDFACFTAKEAEGNTEYTKISFSIGNTATYKASDNIIYDITSENNGYVAKLRPYCYTDKNICKSFLRDIEEYYLVDAYYINTSSNENVEQNKKYYLYKKNAQNTESTTQIKNCELKNIFQCDYSISYEKNAQNKNKVEEVLKSLNPSITKYKNVVLSDTDNANNLQFITNIKADLGNLAFFKRAGYCSIVQPSCTDNSESCKAEKDKYNGCIDILDDEAYFKYVSVNTGNVYYFEKNIIGRQGITCKGYLPKCSEIRDPKPLYKDILRKSENKDGDNNIKARRNYYQQNVSTDKVESIVESNLLFVNSNNFADVNCIDINGIINQNDIIGDDNIKKKLSYDKGYCSDLNNDGTLKYENGLNPDYYTSVQTLEGLNTSNSPISGGVRSKNCYLKSCIDLTPDELRAIAGKKGKFCSEYVWLTNNYGFKYFPKEVDELKLEFCSDKSGKSLKYNQGFEADNAKCYLKNCFSINDEAERQLIVKKNHVEFAKKVKLAYTKASSEGTVTKEIVENKLNTIFFKSRQFCVPGMFFSKDTGSFKDIKFLGMNVAFCNDFTQDQLSAMNINNVIPYITPIADPTYDTYQNNVFCRSGIKPITIDTPNDGTKSETAAIPFFRNILIRYDEEQEYSKEDNLKTGYQTLIGNGNIDYTSDSIFGFARKRILPRQEGSKTVFGKIAKSRVSNEYLSNQAKKSNKEGYTSFYSLNSHCQVVDNLILYRDAAISALNFDDVSDWVKNYSECVNEDQKNDGNGGVGKGYKCQIDKCGSLCNNITRDSEKKDIEKCGECKNTKCNEGIQACRNKFPDEAIINDIFGNISNKAKYYDDCMQNESAADKDQQTCTICFAKGKYGGEDREKIIRECLEAQSLNYDKDCESTKKLYTCKQDNSNEEVFFDYKNIIKDKTVNCSTYNSITSETGNNVAYFECDIYENRDSADTIFNKIFQQMKNLVPYSDVEKDKDYNRIIKHILDTCEQEYKLDDNGKDFSPAISKGDAAFARPFIKYGTKDPKTPNEFANMEKSTRVIGTGSRERAGCATYLAENSDGIKQPANDTLYFNYLNSNDLIKKNFTGAASSNFDYLTQICFRTDNCDHRTNKASDICLNEIPLNGGRSNKQLDVDSIKQNDYKSPDEVIYMFNNPEDDSKNRTGTYITRETIGRSTYFIQNIRFDKAATKTNNLSYHDDELYDQILKECNAPAAATAAAAAAAAIALALAGFFTAPFAWAFGISASIISYATAWDICVTARSGEYDFPLESGVYKPFNYYHFLANKTLDKDEDDVGFLSPVTLTDNNNYYYNYYPRSTNIEQDIANKLNYNKATSDSKGKRFYHGTTRSRDILKACKLEQLLGETNGCLTDDSKDCNFVIRKYDNKTGLVDEGSNCTSTNYMDCLDDTRKECLESFGVQFLTLKDLNNELSVFKNYKDGSKSTWFSNGSGSGDDGVLPVNIIRLAKYNGKEEDLYNIDDCILDKYGDAKGPMSKCRGIYFRNTEDQQVFFPENEAIKRPFLAGPPLFFNLITTNNMPELFEPIFFLKRFKDYSSSEARNAANFSNKTLDFFNPKLHFLYEYSGASLSTDLINQFVDNDSTKLYHTVDNARRYSNVFAARFKSDMVKCTAANYSDCRDFKFIVEKKYESNLDGGFTRPIVCAHKIAMVEDSELNSCFKEADKSVKPELYNNTKKSLIKSCYEADGDGHKYCLDYASTKCPVPVVLDYYCYNRQVPDLRETLVLKQDSDIDFLHPMINAYITPDNQADFSSVIDNTAYAFFSYKNNNSSSNDVDTSRLNQITEYAESATQGITLSFTRSECSQAVYEYYVAFDKYQREQNKPETSRDQTIILRNKDIISGIETNVIPKCNILNGNVNEFLANPDEIKTFKDANKQQKDVVYKKIIKLVEYPESYGGFNEICVSDKVIEGFDSETPILDRVIAFKNKNTSEVVTKTKCMLDGTSLKKPECLIAKKVYAYCDKGSEECVERFNVTKNTYEYVKEIDCDSVRTQLIGGAKKKTLYEQIKACYKGGYNMSGSVRTKDGSKVDTICACQLKDKISNEEKDLFSDSKYWEEREITPRELGLCVNLEEPIICPAVKYYDKDGNYVDDSLALGKTKADYGISEGDKIDLTGGVIRDKSGNSKGAIPDEIVQHLWRTKEKQHGVLPAVFFSENLGHAEFGKGIYCDISNGGSASKCFGGTNIVEGECKGYWQNSTSKAPTAICKKYTTNDGETVYEYEIVGGNKCKRYECNDIGYKDNTVVLDEALISDNSSNLFTDTEIMEYNQNVGINLQNFNVLSNIEESDINKVDKRGRSNGFATWKKPTLDAEQKESEIADFAQKVTTFNCLTGYNFAGSNSVIKTYLNNDSAIKNTFIDYNYVGTGKNETNTTKFIELQNTIKDNLINNNNIKGKLPTRICNQKGEWMPVQDIYNNTSYFEHSSDSLNALYYFNNPFSIDIATDYDNNITKYIRKDYKDNGYCERLICQDITKADINNKNIYDSEYLNTGEEVSAEKNYFWKHTGGAIWEDISATRNSSSSINTSDSGKTASKNIIQIAKTQNAVDTPETSKNLVTYKYLKKVQGQCAIEYGYFNRGTRFVSDNFEDQARELGRFGSKVKPQQYGMIDTSSEGVKPERYCNSYGVWSGVKNNCFRACEMLDIFRADLDDEVVKNAPFVQDDIRVRNSDIVSITTKLALENSEMEHKFNDVYKLDNTRLYDNTIKYTRGDYLTGGARWPRTIVSANTTQRDKNYHNLRYVEVEGTCETRYDNKDDNRARQYKLSGVNIYPKRRCYEDGTWGPVYGDTRCALSKTCSEANISLANLKTLMEIYNDNATLTNDKERTKKLNEVLASSITFDKTKTINAKQCQNNEVEQIGIRDCLISLLGAREASIGSSTSKNQMIFYKELFKVDSETKHFYICNESGLDETSFPGNFLYTGWNFNTPELGDYFIPVTCNMKKGGDSFVFGQKMLNRGIQHLANNAVNSSTNGFEHISGSTISYAKSSNLEFIANNAEIKNTYGENLNDRRDRSIKIGSRLYNSYQITTVCDPDVFYNFMNDGTNDSEAKDNPTYIQKKIILECDKRDDGTVLYGYAYDLVNEHPEGGYRKVATTYENCLPKICGGAQDLYQKNWSSSAIDLFIKGVKQGRYNDDTQQYDTYQSSLYCGDGMAFIVKPSTINSGIENNIKYYTENTNGGINENQAKLYGIVKGFEKVNCVANDSLTSINGVEANNTTYNYAKHGKLEQLSDISEIEFCTTLDKNNCQKLSEEYIANNPEFKEKYCVPIGCSMTNLYSDTSNKSINILQGDENTANTFNLAGATKDSKAIAKVGEIYVIQSMNGDIPNDYIANKDNIVVKDKSTVAGEAICGSNADIYNTGVAVFDFYVDYLNKTGNKMEEASQCFAKLINNDAISKMDNEITINVAGDCPEGYETIEREESGYDFIYGCLFDEYGISNSVLVEKGEFICAKSICYKPGSYTKNTDASGNNAIYVKYTDEYKKQMNYTNNLADAKTAFCADSKEPCNDAKLTNNYGLLARDVIQQTVLNKYFDKVSLFETGLDSSNVANGELLTYLNSIKDATEKAIHEGLYKGYMDKTISSLSNEEIKALFAIKYTTGEKVGLDDDKDLEEVVNIDNIDIDAVKLYNKLCKTNSSTGTEDTDFSCSKEFFKSNVGGSDIYFVKLKDFNEKVCEERKQEYVNICEVGNMVNDTTTGECKCELEAGKSADCKQILEWSDPVCKNVEGTVYLRLDRYYSDFIEEYNKKKNELIEAELAVINDTKNTNYGQYKDIYEYYMNVLRMKEFLTVGDNNQYYSDYVLNVKDINAVFNENILKYTYEVSDTSDYMINIAYNILNKQYTCSKTIFTKNQDTEEFEETTEETILSCSTELIDKYNSDVFKYFTEFLPKEKISKETNSKCNEHYNNYLTAKKEFSPNGNANFKNGFFMGIQCTLDGWKTLDSPTCKGKCNYYKTAEYVIDPQGPGNYKVWFELSNFRYNVSFEVAVPAHAGGNFWAKSRKHLTYKAMCQDNGNGTASFSQSGDVTQKNSSFIWMEKNKGGIKMKGKFSWFDGNSGISNTAYTKDVDTNPNFPAILAPKADGSYNLASHKDNGTSAESTFGSGAKVIIHADWRKD